jgi:2C-methyl-D-erythritol 2,4-cyclodiphosphate synthase
MIPTTYDVNPDFIIQPYQKGIRLVRPMGNNVNDGQLCISKLNALSAQVAFTNVENEYVAANDRLIDVMGATSVNDCLGKSAASFSNNDLAQKVMKNYNDVMHTRAMKIIEESGARIDDLPIQAISFRFPWFDEKKIIGTLNLSILINQPSMQNFAMAMADVLSTGLLGATATPVKIQSIDTYFTKRENEILTYLLKGYTAKNIANTLVLSKRTVEHHIENMKHKSCCDSTIDLLNKYYNKVISDSNIK